MADVDERIERFRKMAEADPDNELGHFSLGKALLDAGQAADAAASLARTIALNPNLSKAYELLAEAQRAAGDNSAAVKTLQTGYARATERGDRMPAKSMAAILEELGAAVPATAAAPATAATATSTSGFACRRCGGGEPMADPPMRGELGQQIKASVCSACWHEWIGMGTKVINELQLDLREPEAQAAYDQHMKEFFGLS
jgi:Fe-S cluster biosynthesis and repair protein YggX